MSSTVSPPPDVIDSFHRDISIFMGSGMIASLIGLSSYLMSYEFQDFDRVGLESQNRMQENFNQRKKISIAIMSIAAFIYVSGIVLLTLGVSLYREEREEVSSSIPGIIVQIKQKAAQPDINEVAILAGIAGAVIIIGMMKSALNFQSNETWGWIGSSIYTAGWLAMAFAASMNNKSITSLVGERLAWCLPGVSLIVAGTFIIPWQLHYNYITGPGFPLQAIGYVCLWIGTSFLTPAPS